MGAGSAEDPPAPGGAEEKSRWLRDLGALLALPALWVDHEPAVIVTSLLSVLFGVLELESAYARFEDAVDDGCLEIWRPQGPQPPIELRRALDGDRSRASGLATSDVDAEEFGPLRVSSLPLTLPWGTALVVVSARRGDFPTLMEEHLLKVAVSQAGIAIHLAQRLAHEHEARASAEDALLDQTELLRSLVADVQPSLASVAQRIEDATRFVADTEALRPDRNRPAAPVASLSGDAGPSPAPETRPEVLPLTRREAEVLALLADGLTNREMAALLWLSDRTVERHITGLYRKIGVARRSEATAFALRHGFSSNPIDRARDS
jgi:DNA-binding CsgD family transcriptional regulator